MAGPPGRSAAYGYRPAAFAVGTSLPMPSAGGSTAAYVGAGTRSTGVASGGSDGSCSPIRNPGRAEGLSTRTHLVRQLRGLGGRQVVRPAAAEPLRRPRLGGLAHRVDERTRREAAAQVPGERLADRRLARLRLPGQECAHAQPDPGQAVAATRAAVRGERGRDLVA